MKFDQSESSLIITIPQDPIPQDPIPHFPFPFPYPAEESSDSSDPIEDVLDFLDNLFD